jgi:hypothetical protein
MNSSFSRSRKTTSAGSKPFVDEQYDFRGLNVTDPDQVTDQHHSPYLINCRMYAKNDGDKRVAMRTRKGSTRLSAPVGEALDVQNIASSIGDATFDVSNWIAEPFTPSSSGALTKLEFEIKRTASGSGHVIVEIYSDNAGSPGVMLAQGSIYASLITTSYQYLSAYFMDAPSLVSGTQYWHRLRVATKGTAQYAVNKTVAAGGMTTVTPGTIYAAAGYTWRYKSYLSIIGSVLGYTRRYPQNKQNRTLFAMGTNVYSVDDAGVATSISSAIGALTKKVRFDQIDDKTFWVDGTSTGKQWDGTTVSDIANLGGTPSHIIAHQNRLFVVDPSDPCKVRFSALFDFTSWRNVDFFYVPNPKSPDWISGLVVFQDNLVVMTRKTKHVVFGSDLSSFQRRQALGTKGAVSQEAIAVDRNYVYFLADDKNLYRWNGVEDEWLSEKVEPLLRQINDISKVRLHIYRNQLRLYYPSGTDTVANDMLLLELSKKDSNKYLEWFHDNGRAVAGSLEWDQDNNELIEFSSKVGAIYNGETGESDLGKIISFRYWTHYKPYGSGAAKDRIKRFRPYVRPSSTPYVLRVGKDVDFADKPQMADWTVDAGGTIWGTFVWGDGSLWGDGKKLIDDKVPMSGRGKHTQYRFECDELDCPVNLYGYIGLVKSGRVR